MVKSSIFLVFNFKKLQTKVNTLYLKKYIKKGLKKFMKNILFAMLAFPFLVMAQPYSPNLQTNQPFNTPSRGASSNCGSMINTISNCGFETGDLTGWTVTDLTTPFFPVQVVTGGADIGFGFFVTAPTEGSFAAVNGFDGDGPGQIEIAQDIVMPGTAENLTFDYRGAWDLASFGAAIDRTFEVQIQPSGGGAALQSTLILTAPIGDITLDTGDIQGSVNVSSYAGQSVRIAFVWNIPEVNTGPAFMQLDNVAITGPPPRIPTLSFYGLLLAAILLLFVGTRIIYRRSHN